MHNRSESVECRSVFSDTSQDIVRDAEELVALEFDVSISAQLDALPEIVDPFEVILL